MMLQDRVASEIETVLCRGSKLVGFRCGMSAIGT
jgi:hypothetical protein